MKYILLTITLLLLSCTTNEQVSLFNASPIERINKATEDLKTTLKSADKGWLVTYRPGNNNTSVWTLLLKFVDDENVEITSDFDLNSLSKKTSTYKITVGTALKLIFDTYNYNFHIFTDSDVSYDDAGKGLEGSNSFLYYGKLDNGNQLDFRANKDVNNKIKFVKWNNETEPNFKKNIDDLVSIFKELKNKYITLKATDSKNNILDYSHITTSTIRRMSITTTTVSNNKRVRNTTVSAYYYISENNIHILDYKINNTNENTEDLVFDIENGKVENNLKSYTTTLNDGTTVKLSASPELPYEE